MSRPSAISPETFPTFGDLLKHLRRQAGLTQRELSIAVGYSESQMSRLEQNQRVPDAATLTARFVPALHLEHEPKWAARLLELAADARRDDARHGDARHDDGPAPTVDVSAPKHNLPVQVTHFFGREVEVAQLKERLAAHPLVTLVGSGGVGKTRLSLQAASELVDDFAAGVWFTGLAPLTDPALVPQQAAVSLGLRDEPGRPILDSLTDFLRPRQTLLVLDNCEHLLEACAQLADSLLRACPRLKILASSREPLGITGEAVLAVPSLPFPAAGLSLDAERLSSYAAIQLFIDRARLVLPDYTLTPENAAALARICQRLDGIPLALEMAAARMNLLSTEQLADRLDNAFRLLTGGSRTALPRQQTLRATMDWSYRLLREEERLLLQRLSVFAGGCTLEAAEAVCAGEGLGGGDVLEFLAALVTKSMVIADRQPGKERRYRLLETVRQYAREKLQEAGETARLHTRHRDYFLALVESKVPKFYSRERYNWAAKLKVEHENLRFALEWSFNDLTNVEAGPRLVIPMRGLWPSFQEDFNWCKRAINYCQGRMEISSRLYASLLATASHVTALNDPETALDLGKQAVEISRQLGSQGKETLMWILCDLGWTYMVDLDAVEQALAPYAEAEALFRELEPAKYPIKEYQAAMAYFAYLKALIASKQGRHRDAKMEANKSIQLYTEIDDQWGQLVAQRSLGNTCLSLEESEQARDHFLEALHLAEEIGAWEKASILRSLGQVDFQQGNLGRAMNYCHESMREADKMPDRNIIASGLGLMAAISAKQGRPIRAARLAGASAAMWAKQKRKPWEDSSLDTLLPGWRDGPDYAAITQAFEAGQAMSTEEAVAYALESATDE